MATLASDNFDRGDSGNLGANWTDDDAGFAIVSNKAVGATGGDQTYWSGTFNPASADYDVTVTLHHTGDVSELAFFGRRTASNNFYWVAMNTFSQTIKLYKRVTGSDTELGSYTGGYSVNNTYTFRLNMVGSTIKVYEGLDQRISITDTDITDIGKPGLLSTSPNGTCDWDDFLVEGTEATTTSTTVSTTTTLPPNEGRLWSCGFELNSLTPGVEISSIFAGSPTIVTSPVRSGTYALNCNTTSSGTGFRYQFSESETVIYVRFYIQLASAPDGETPLLDLEVAPPNFTGVEDTILLDTDRTLRLRGIGDKSSALSLNTWYRVELFYDISTPSSTVITGRLNGVQFSTQTYSHGTATYVNQIVLGLLAPDVICQAYFDDIAINITDWPGSGRIVHLKTISSTTYEWTHDDNTGADVNNYTEINEVIPDDATSYLKTDIQTLEDQFTVEDLPVDAEIINLASIGVRYRGEGASENTSFSVGLETSESFNGSDIITPASTTWITNANIVPRNYPYTVYGETVSSINGANLYLDSLLADTNKVNVSTLWLLVDYTTVADLTTTSTSTTQSTSTSSTTTSSSTSTTQSTSTSSTTTSSSTSTTQSTSTSSTTTSSSTTKSTSTSSTTTSSS